MTSDRLRLETLADDLGSGRITSVQLVETCLTHIDSREEEVQAWVNLRANNARDEAKAADIRRSGSRQLSPLDGIPFGVKDNIDTADLPAEMGSAIHAGRSPAKDAAIVARMRKLGMILLGKTVTSPFGMNVPTPTLNPLDPDRTLGASSVGSAAAVAAGMVPITLNTQNTSSSTRPAAYAGVYAWKPAHGRLPLDGMLALAPSVTHPAFIGSSLGGLAMIGECLELLHGSALFNRSDAPRMGFVKGPWWHLAEPDAAQAFSGLMAGMDIAELCLPSEFDGVIDAHSELIGFEMAVSLAHEYETARDMLPREAVQWIERGLALDDGDRARFLKQRGTASQALASALAKAGAEAVVTFSTPGRAPRRGIGRGEFSMPWTFIGWPTLSVPVWFAGERMPIGLQIISPPGHEEVAFQAASFIDRHAGFASKRQDASEMEKELHFSFS